MTSGTRNGSSAHASRVLVIDDEPTIADVLARYLRRAGFQTREAHTGPDAVAAALSWRPDLIVLDVMLPGFDGLEVMRRVRAAGGEGNGTRGPAVILLTARAEETDRVGGLRRGADDYVVKPFSPAEVVARVDAVLRRSAWATRAMADGRIEREGLTIDRARRTVERDGSPIALTALEFDLLAHLASNPGRVFTRDQLLEEVWREPCFSTASTVTVHIRRLRAKIEHDPAHPTYIQTARGVGYRFRAAERGSTLGGRR